MAVSLGLSDLTYQVAFRNRALRWAQGRETAERPLEAGAFGRRARVAGGPRRGARQHGTMRRVFTLLLAAIVGVHAALGCCVHHVHAGAAREDHAPMVTSTGCHCDAHDDDAERAPWPATSVQETNHSQPSRHCAEGRCTFTAPRRLDVVRERMADAPAVFLDTAEACGFVHAEACVCHTRSDPAMPAASRRHLVLSILLI